jgi:hypothetical protein
MLLPLPFCSSSSSMSVCMAMNGQVKVPLGSIAERRDMLVSDSRAAGRVEGVVAVLPSCWLPIFVVNVVIFQCLKNSLVLFEKEADAPDSTWL